MSQTELLQLAETVEEEDGITCRIIEEPNNEVDPMAVMVLGLDAERDRYTGVKFGYVQRPANEYLFELLQRGATVTNCFLMSVDAQAGSGELDLQISLPPGKTPANKPKTKVPSRGKNRT